MCLPLTAAAGPYMGGQGYGPPSAPASGVPLQGPVQTRVERYRRRPGAAEKTLVKSPVKRVLMRGQDTVELVRLWAGCAEYFADQHGSLVCAKLLCNTGPLAAVCSAHDCQHMPQSDRCSGP